MASYRICQRHILALKVPGPSITSRLMRHPCYRPKRRSFRRPVRKAVAMLILAMMVIGILTGGESVSSGRAGSTRQQAVLIDDVIRVRDGDTLVVGLIPIRLANLDCGESGTSAGEAATRRMNQLVRGQTMRCELEGRRSYDREVGVCALPDGRDVGEVLIAERFCARW